MDWLIILLLSCFFIFVELLMIYLSPPKKIEIDSASKTAPLKIYTNYFFLPFTTKIIEYYTLQNVNFYVNRSILSNKSLDVSYGLILQLPEKEILLMKGNKNALLKEQEAINQCISSSKKYILSNNSSFNIGLIICLFLFVFSLAIIKCRTDIIINEFLKTFCMSYMISTVLFFILILSSLRINYLNKHKNDINKIKIGNIKYSSNEKYVKNDKDWNSNAKKIYDSIIK